MSNRITCDFSQLEGIREKLERLQSEEIKAFNEDMVRELAARLLRKVVRRTPVGKNQYSDKLDEDGNVMFYKRGAKKGQAKKTVSYVGGHLRRSWTIGNIVKNATVYSIEIINPAEYASYVEFGHRQKLGRYVPAIGKQLKAGWVLGKFMLKISEKELEEDAEKIIKRRLNQVLKGVFND